MPYNGSGVFVRLYSWVNDAAANIKIRADRMDNEMNGMATGLSTCITKDGQTTITANLPMAGFRHTGTGAGTSRTDYTRLDQAQDGKLAWVDGGGTADAITAAYAIPITTLVDGQLCYVRATAANATTTPTFSPSSLTARTIVKNGGQALAAGDIAGDGHEIILRYDLTNTRWELMNPKGSSVPYTAASASGPASLQFAEDTDNGTNKVTVSAPSSLGSDVDVTLPNANGILVGTGSGNIVTNAMLADMNANTVKARAASSSGSPSDVALSASQLLGRGSTGDIAAISLGAGLSMSGTTLSGGGTLATPQTTTSGTSIDFTGIPAGVTQITMGWDGVSTNGTDQLLVQLGDSGGVETSGYAGVNDDTSSRTTFSIGFPDNASGAAFLRYAYWEFTLLDSSTNTWYCKGTIGFNNSGSYGIRYTVGTKSLSGTLDRIRVTTSGGTNTFDAGKINIRYS